MRFPKFGLFARASKPITRSVSPNSAAADRSKRGRHSKPSTTTKRKRSITYMANKSQRFYPSDLFPVPPPSSSMPLTNYNHSSNVTGLVPATSHHASVPVRANVGGERHDLLWLPPSRRSTLPFTPSHGRYRPRATTVPTNSEEFIDWPPWPASHVPIALPADFQTLDHPAGLAAAGYGQPSAAHIPITNRAMQANATRLGGVNAPQPRPADIGQSRLVGATMSASSLHTNYGLYGSNVGGEWIGSRGRLPASSVIGRRGCHLGRHQRRKKVHFCSFIYAIYWLVCADFFPAQMRMRIAVTPECRRCQPTMQYNKSHLCSGVAQFLIITVRSSFHTA